MSERPSISPASAPVAPRSASGSDEILHGAAMAVSSTQGDAVFRDLVRYLAANLDVDVAFVALPTEAASCRLRMLALVVDAQMVEDVEYELAGTPCETVIGQTYRIYPSELQRLFPIDIEFKNMGLECYAGYPLNDSRGQPLGLIAVASRRSFANPVQVESMLKIFAARVVTELEHRRADQALQLAEASYRAIFDAAEDAIFVHDWDTGAIVDVNPKACEVYGYSVEELRRASIGDISAGEPPFTAADAARWLELAKRTGSAQFEWHRRNRDGSLHWDEVRLKSAVINGRPHILGFTREITERKQAEAALRASEERYRLLFEMESDAILLVDVATLAIVDANRAALALYGYERNELLQLTATELSMEPDFTAHAIRRHGGPARVPLRFHRRKGGETFPVEIANNTIDLSGRPTMLAAIRDVTERHEQEQARSQLEAQLRQAQKMEAIGHLTGGIAHDFNNILTSIMGYVALAADRTAVSADPKLEHYLDQAQSAVRRARDLIRQMLTFSRGQRGEPRPIALAAVVSESAKLLRSTLPTSVDLVTRVGRDLPNVMLDPVHLEQILLNLCINARDAMQSSGTIHVTLEAVAVGPRLCASCRQRVAGSYVELAVRDSGPGITAAVMDRMFEPFFTTKEVGKGSGMGLATVHGIVHEYGGHVCVETVAGGGTTFRVLFAPLGEDASAVENAAAAAANIDHAGARLHGRVLVVEDEEMVAALMQELLDGWGLQTTVVRHPAEAESWFMQDPQRVDLVLSDYTMPKLTGLELAQRLTLVRPDLPVLLYSGYGTEIDPADAARRGVSALIRKPVEPTVLFDILREHLPLAAPRPQS